MFRSMSDMGLKPLYMSVTAAVASALLVATAAPALAQGWNPADRAAVLASGVVGDAVVEALDVSGEVRVVIAYYGRAGRDRADAIAGRVAARDLAIRHRFRRLPAMAAMITRDGLLALVVDPRVRRVDVDAGGSGSLGVAVPLVGLDVLEGQGFGGAGITVALLDTGADVDHVDLADSIVAEQCFCTSCCPDASSEQSGPGSAEDDNGHGTNIAGVVTSNGGVAPLGGAPDADLVLVKVLDASNSFCCASDVIAGLDWIIAQRPDVDVVNMSLGTSASYVSDCDEANSTTMAFAAAVDALRTNGVLVLTSSGNTGLATTMPAPACVGGAIAVGASDDSDDVWPLSNADPMTDLVAPGVGIQSTGPADGTTVYTGTSQASALASACAAVLLQANPTATADDVASALAGSTTILNDPKNGRDYPRLDCEESHALLPEPRVGLLAAAAILTLTLARLRSRPALRGR
jgi:subtilisin family serine protease